MWVCVLNVRPLLSFYHPLSFDLLVHFVTPALAQTFWAQHASDNRGPFVMVAPTRKGGNNNWLVLGAQSGAGVWGAGGICIY